MEKVLERLFKKAWCRETSAYPERWCEENSACGQCLSTAMVVQYFLGGKILFARTSLGPHFWSILPDGIEKDFTFSQLPKDFILPRGEEVTGELLHRFGKIVPDASQRYNLLFERLKIPIIFDKEVLNEKEKAN